MVNLTLRQKFLIARENIRRKKQLAFAQKLQKLRAKRLKARGKLQLRQALHKERAAIRQIKVQKAAISAKRFRRLTAPTVRTFKKVRRVGKKVTRRTTKRKNSGDFGLSIGGDSGLTI